MTKDLAGCKLDGSAIVFEDSDLEEVSEEGLVVGGPEPEKVCNMAGDEVVNFEDENGVDDARAMQDACRNLQNFEFEENDLLFYFQQIEAKMSAVGVKKNFTKFQVLSTMIRSSHC